MRTCLSLLTDKSYAVELSIEASAALVVLRCAGAGCAGLGSKEFARDTMLRLRNVAQIYDIEHGCLVGEEQMADV